MSNFHEPFKKLLIFLFNSIYINIISHYFYSTTSSFSKNKVLYFLRSEWNRKSNIILQTYLESFDRIENIHQSKPVATLRSIPKENGFRVISNCRNLKSYSINGCNFDSDTKGKSSINTLMLPFYYILKEESKNYLKSSIYSLAEFKELIPNPEKDQFYYLAKMDLKNCFDNIPSNKIFQIVDVILEKDLYFYKEIVKIVKNDSIMERQTLRSSPEIMYPINLDTKIPAQEAIIKEKRVKIYQKSEVATRIKDLLEETLIYYQSNYYKNKSGILQGCCISSLLCALFFGHLDSVFDDIDCTVRRYVDDFLIISKDKDEIVKFFKRASELKESGLHINYSKINANFNLLQALGMPENTCTDTQNSHVEWCGMKIYERGLDIKGTVSNEHFRYSVYLKSLNSGASMLRQNLGMLKRKCRYIFINKHNRKVGENLFDIFYFFARRFRIEFLRMNFVNRNFLLKCMKRFVANVKDILKSRRINFDSEKVDQISDKAFELNGLFSFQKKSFD